MTLVDLKDVATIFQSIITPTALIIGGLWAYRRYGVEAKNLAHIETSADIVFIGQQGDFWIVELLAILNNKGNVQHKIEKFTFDLNALHSDDPIEVSDRWGGQVNRQRIVPSQILPIFLCRPLSYGQILVHRARSKIGHISDLSLPLRLRRPQRL
jgi:hypothetical protein